MAVCHCCQLEPVKMGTILSRALDMVVNPVVKSTKSASECNNGQAKMEVHLVPVKALLSTAILRTRSQSAHFVARLRPVAVQELNWELTVLHSIKLVKAMLQGAGVLPGALLHSVRSMGLITC